MEQVINGVENMTYMTTSAGSDGSVNIQVFFKVGTNPDIASVNVQNRLATITSELPEEMVRVGIKTSKIENSNIMYLSVKSDVEEFDEQFVQNYIGINLIPQIKRIPGVGKIDQFGVKDFAMRVWLNPVKVGNYNLSVEEIIGAIREQNIEIAAGSIGQNSDARFEYMINYRGKYSLPEEFGDIVIRTGEDGSLLYLKDVAEITLGSFSYLTNSWINRKPGITIGIAQTSGSNANEIITHIETLLRESEKTMPPGVEFVTLSSRKDSLNDAISEVFTTLILAFILVFFVVYIFLQDIRSTILIGLCIPVSIIGAFFVMNFAGLSLNLLTLFALVLSIGIVVDNATVVIELIARKMQTEKISPKPATYSAMSEITGAVISSTLVMIAVFAPVIFVEGAVGLFYQQFAISMMAALVLSGVYSLTLCPALAALIMKGDKTGGSWYSRFEKNYELAFNSVFTRFTKSYGKIETRLIKNRKTFILAFVAVLLAAGIFMWKTPRGFVPAEDDSFLMAFVNLPATTTLEYTDEVMDRISGMLLEHPAVKSLGNSPGMDIMNNIQKSSAGVFMISLRPYKERGDVKNIDDVQNMLSEQIYLQYPEVSVYIVHPPSLPGFGNFGGAEFILQDREGRSLEEFNEVAEMFAGSLMESAEVAYAMISFDAQTPQYTLEIDYKKAKQLGVDVSHLAQTVQVYYGSLISSDFNRFGRNYKVILQANAENRKTPESFNNIYVSGSNHKKIPINTVASLKESKGALAVSRFNMYNSILINVEAKPGISTGQVIEAVETLAAERLPSGYSYEWQGVAREEKNSSSGTIFIFLLSFILVFLILAAQYDSFFMPAAILLSVPTALVGVFLGVNIGGLDNNIFVQVAILMLIGLIGKNSILIVENALQLRKEGYTIVRSAVLAARSRLRPILMTSLTSVLGAVPMVFAIGPSAIGNHSISAATIGGMLSGIVGGLLFTPPLFVLLRTLEEKIMKFKREESETVKEEIQ
jgi:HAE1 family hydrophobic/amphiphilic exporter-1